MPRLIENDCAEHLIKDGVCQVCKPQPDTVAVGRKTLESWDSWLTSMELDDHRQFDATSKAIRNAVRALLDQEKPE